MIRMTTTTTMKVLARIMAKMNTTMTKALSRGNEKSAVLSVMNCVFALDAFAFVSYFGDAAVFASDLDCYCQCHFQALY